MKEYFKDFINKVQKKLLERITIMFIPHGNEKIYSFHLSWMIIIFLMITFLMLLSIGYNAYIKYQEISNKIKELKQLFGKNYEYTYEVQGSLLKAQNLTKKNFQTYLEEFYKKQDLNLPSYITYGVQYKKGEEVLKKEIEEKKELMPGTDYLHSTYVIKGIQNYLKLYNKILQRLESSLVGSYELYYKIPNGRPVKQNRFRDTSPYGIRLDPVLGNQLEFHTGIDMAGEMREPIFSTGDGVVKKVFYDPGYGYTVIIQHPSNYSTLYAHLSQPLVLPEKKIRKGDLIALMGATGRVTGTHLHYEVILPSGKKIDPFPFVCLSDLTYRCKN